MTNEFPTGSARKTYKECVFIEQEKDPKIFEELQTEQLHRNMETRMTAYAQNWLSKHIEYGVSAPLKEMLHNPDFLTILEDLINFGKARYERDYSNRYQDTDFVLYQKYTYEDVCRLLNWENSFGCFPNERSPVSFVLGNFFQEGGWVKFIWVVTSYRKQKL